MKKWLSLFLLFPLIWGNLAAKTNCADYGYEFTGQVFWNPNVMNSQEYRPFYFSFDRLYEYTWNDPAQQYKDNSEEWIQYCKNQTDTAGVNAVVYNSTLEELQAALQAVKNGKPLPNSLKNNTMLKYLQSQKDIPTLTYLVFAKKCEPHVTMSGEAWEESSTRNKSSMQQILKEGQTAYNAEKSEFLKMRYAFQLVRLAHYSEEEAQAISLYEKLVAPLKMESVVKYWALGQKAGALLNSGRRAEGLYALSVVFEKCPSKRVNMYYNFHPENDDEFQGAMKLCKNEKEKANLYLLRAIHPNAQAIEEMSNIYQISPESEYMSLLLVREINKLESAAFGYDFNFDLPIKMEMRAANAEDGDVTGMTGEYLYKFKDFVQTIVQENKVKNKLLWQMANAYLEFLGGKNDKANKHLQQLAQTAGLTSIQKQQVQVFQYINDLSYVNSLNPQNENELYSRYEKLNLEQRSSYEEEWEWKYAPKPIYALIKHHFIPIYEKQGEDGKALLFKKSIQGFFGKDVQAKMVDEVLTWVDAPRSALERHLLTLITDHKGWEKDVLLDVKGTQALRKGDLRTALSVFQGISQGYQNSMDSYFQIQFNPFEGFIKDCHECTEGKYNSPEYSKFWMAKKMQSLDEEAKNNPAKAAENYFKIGNAWYNTTFYAPGWRALAYGRSSVVWDAFENTEIEDGDFYATYLKELQNEAITDMRLAIKNYERALELNPDKELAARIHFMLAKCRLNQTYAQTEGITPATVQAIYKKLKTDYADTRFYKDAIRECGYLREYVKK